MSTAFAELGAMAVKWQNRPQPNLIGLLAKGSLECRSWVKKTRKRMEKKGGGLSQSEKELKKLLGTNNGRNELDSEQKDDNDDDDDDVRIYQKSQENSQKMSKHGHGNQKSTKRSQRIKAEAKKSQRQMKIDGQGSRFKSSQVQWQGQRGQINSHSLTLKLKATSIMEKAQIHMGFCAKTLTKETQCHPKGNDTLAIFRCPHNDPTAYNSSSNDWEMNGRD
ncbi:hypothetical protein Tco_0328469 [Tanacetum coccineum]